jgi:hypothetical protein
VASWQPGVWRRSLLVTARHGLDCLEAFDLEAFDLEAFDLEAFDRLSEGAPVMPMAM